MFYIANELVLMFANMYVDGTRVDHENTSDNSVNVRTYKVNDCVVALTDRITLEFLTFQLKLSIY